MNKFTELYKTSSNSDLLNVIENKTNYQPEAVEAATTEINLRNLSDQELTVAKNELESRRQEKQKQNYKRTKVELKVKSIVSTVLNTLNPIQKSIPNADRLINLISIIFGFLAVYQLIMNIKLFIIIFSEHDLIWLAMSDILPSIILFIAVILFAQRKKIGWILLAIILTYSSVIAIEQFILSLIYKPTGLIYFDTLFKMHQPKTYLIKLIFFSGSLWSVCKNNITNKFEIKRRTIFTTIITAALISIIFVFVLL